MTFQTLHLPAPLRALGSEGWREQGTLAPSSARRLTASWLANGRNVHLGLGCRGMVLNTRRGRLDPHLPLAGEPPEPRERSAHGCIRSPPWPSSGIFASPMPETNPCSPTTAAHRRRGLPSLRVVLPALLLALAIGCECSPTPTTGPTPPGPTTSIAPAPVPSPPLQANRAPLTDLYPVHFPDELYAIWEVARRLRPDAPRSAFDAVGVRLCGPFDVLAGERRDEELALPMLLHWRFFLDPPEMFTVASGDTDGLHWGYWFDETNQASAVAHYYARDAYEIVTDGTTLTSAMVRHIGRRIDSARENIEYDADHADEYRRQIEAATALRVALVEAATARGEWPAPRMARSANVPTFDGMGVRVEEPALGDAPVDAERVFRRAGQGEGAALVAEATAALEAGHPGLALLLARPAWTARECEAQHADAAEVMARAYTAIGRERLALVLRTHQEHRDMRSVDITHAPEAGGR